MSIPLTDTHCTYPIMKTCYQSSPSVSKDQIKKKRKQKMLKKQFYLTQSYQAQNAKKQLVEISQIQVTKKINQIIDHFQSAEEEGGRWNQKIQQWNKYYSNMNHTTHQSKIKKIDNCYIKMHTPEIVHSASMLPSARKRYKTDSHSSAKNFQKNKYIRQQLKKIIKIQSVKNKQKQLKEKTCFSQIVKVIPQFNQHQYTFGKVDNCNNTTMFCPISTVCFQIPIGLKNQKLKGTFYQKSQVKKNLYLKRGNNSVLMQTKKATHEENNRKPITPNSLTKFIKQRSKSTMALKVPHKKLMSTQQRINSKELQKCRSMAKKKNNIQLKIPIYRQLQQLKKFICKDSSNYIQFGDSCPMKKQQQFHSNVFN